MTTVAGTDATLVRLRGIVIIDVSGEMTLIAAINALAVISGDRSSHAGNIDGDSCSDDVKFLRAACSSKENGRHIFYLFG